MSYLQKKGGTPSFKECIISFWFRVPGASMDSIAYDNETEPEPVLNGVLPLLVLGAEGIEEGRYDLNPKPTLYYTVDFTCTGGQNMDTHAEVISDECTSWNDFHFVYDFHCCLIKVTKTMYTATPSTTFLCEDYHREDYRVVYAPEYKEQKSCPTCIGITRDGKLYVNFQTNMQPTITGDEPWELVTSIDPGESISTSGAMEYKEGLQTSTIYYDSGLLGCVGLAVNSTVEGPTVHPHVSGTGSGKAPVEHKSSFPILPYETGKFFSNSWEANWSNNIRVSPDRWHHVLVSVKLQPTAAHNYPYVYAQSDYGYDGGSLLYIALDDKNYTKGDLSDMWWWGGSEGHFGENEVFPDMAWDIATDSYSPDLGPPFNIQMTYSLPNPEVPAGFIGLPAVDNYVDNIRQVELAELQIWFGKSFDTGDVSNRRLFIDENGKPVKIEDKKAADVLGTPDVLLHGSSNWKRGINKGALAPSSDTGTPSPWFTPVPADGIERWKPDPSLYGPQSPNQKEPAS